MANPTPIDIRQAISRDLLDQITGVSNSQIDTALLAINKELTPPLRMVASSSPDQTVTIENIFVQNPSTLRNYVIPPISNTLPNFTSGTVTLPTVSGGTVTVTPGNDVTLTLSVGNFIKMGISLDANGQLVVQFGTEGASISAATVPPVPNNTFAIGYVVVENIGGTIQTIDNQDIYQFIGGGGGGGSGNANSFLETLKNQLQDSIYGFLTPNIFSQDETGLVDPSSTGSFSLVTQNYEFSASSQFMLTKQLLDSDFLDDGRDLGQVDLTAKWDIAKLDTAATYEVSRDGGLSFETVSMSRVGESGTYAGTHKFQFDLEETVSYIVEENGAASITFLDTGANQSVGQKFSIKQKTKVGKLGWFIRSSSPAPSGNFNYKIVGDSNGTPDLSTVHWTGANIAANSPSTSFFEYMESTVSGVTLDIGDYWLLVETDAAYKTGVTGGSGTIDALLASSSLGTPIQQYNGTSWTTSGTNPAMHLIQMPDGSTIASQLSSDGTLTFNTTTSQSISQAVTLTSAQVFRTIELKFAKLGTPTGKLHVDIKADSSGAPGATLISASPIEISHLPNTSGSGNTQQQYVVDIPAVSLAAGTYHIVLSTDTAYKSSFIASTTELQLISLSTGSTKAQVFDGTSWSASTDEAYYGVFGRPLDGRVKITASATDKALEGLGLFYDNETGTVVSGTAKIQKFKFKAVADNFNEFTITNFLPSPDFLKIYHVEAGKVFKLGAFTLNGHKAIFPANTFNNGGVETDVTLIALEEGGGAFDNNDRNALLLTANHLGSTDVNIDRSVAGQGIFLRRPDGTLREIAIDDSDNIVVYSV